MALAAAMPAFAQAPTPTRASAVQPGFVIPEGRAQIMLFEPDIGVSEQTAGGLAVPSADWTADARANVETALVAALAERNILLNTKPKVALADEPLMKDYRALFRAIASAAFTHKLFPGDALPTKSERFDWTLGPGVAALKKLGGGDYGLFIYSSDAYDSRGRKAVEAIGKLLGEKSEAGTHIGYAGLVDLATGDLVWVSANVKMLGDVRTIEGATLRAEQLLQGFPARATTVKVGDAR